MVPRSRLLWWTAVVLVPFSATAATIPAAKALSVLIVAGFLLLVLGDLFASWNRLNGVEVVLPVLVRFARRQESAIDFRVRSEQRPLSLLRLCVALPAEVGSRQDEVRLRIPKAGTWFSAAWPCYPVQRGCYRAEILGLETPSRLGFWDLRRRRACKMELRVYPNLREKDHSLASLFLHRAGAGLHPQRQVGKGREFEKLREYIPGDSYEDIHWKSTAKHGSPITKMYQVERTQEVYVLVDASRLSARHVPDSVIGTDETAPPVTVLERFVTGALVLGLCAEQQGDLFGLITFSNKVDTCLKAGHGKAHFNACRDALYTVNPVPMSPDYGELCSFIRTRLRKRSLLLFLTSLDDPVMAREFRESVQLICREHLVLVNMLRPPGARALFDGPEPKDLDTVYRHLGGHVMWHTLRERERELSRLGVHLEQIDQAGLTARLVSRYMLVKQKQML